MKKGGLKIFCGTKKYKEDNGCYVVNFASINDPELLHLFDAEKWVNQTEYFASARYNMGAMPAVIFDQFPKYEELMIATGLRSIQKDDFVDVKYITRLFLFHNELRTVPSNTFQYTSNLEVLDLSNNDITTVEDFAFNGLNNLQRISLMNNSLVNLTRNIFAGVENLKWLDLARNQIEFMDDEAFNLPKLEYLFLSRNRIQRISNNLFLSTPNLIRIQLEQNALTRIGRAFRSLQNVSRISLDDNHIKDFNLEEFLGLEELSLRNTSLPLVVPFRSHRAASPLTYLDVSDNGWSAPDIFSRLQFFTNLETLDLADNNFREINDISDPKKYFPKLQRLELNGNNFACQKISPILDNLRTIGINFRKTVERNGRIKNYAGVSCF